MDKNENVVDIKEIVLNLLYHWKGILITILVCAISLAGISYGVKFLKWNNNKDKQNVNNQLEKNLTDAEIDYVDRVAKIYESSLESQEKYRGSYLANMDYSKVNKITLDYYINGVEQNEATEVMLDDLVEAYCSYFESDEFRTGAAKILPQTNASEMAYLIVVKKYGHTLNIEIKGVNKNDVNSLKQYVQETVENVSKEFSSLIIDHNISGRGENFYVGADSDISLTQLEYLSGIARQKESIKQYIMQMRTAQVKLFEERLSATVPELFSISYENLGLNVENATILEKPSISKKALAAGAVFGLGIAMVVYSILFLFGRNVVSPSDVRDNYGIRILGILKNGADKSNGYISHVYENAVDNSKENVNRIIQLVSLKEEESNKIALISSVLTTEEIEQQFGKLEGIGPKIVVLGNDAFEKEYPIRTLQEVDDVIFVEKFKKTSKKVFKERIDLCNIIGIRILGGLFLI